MPTSLEPLLQIVSGTLEAITPFALGRTAKHEVLVALTPIANRLQDLLAQVPFALQGQQLIGLEEEVRRLGEVAVHLQSRLSAAQRRDLEDLQNLLTRFLLNAPLAGYSEGFAVVSRVRQFREDLT